MFSYAFLFARSAETTNTIAAPASAIPKGLRSNQKAMAEPMPHNPPKVLPYFRIHACISSSVFRSVSNEALTRCEVAWAALAIRIEAPGLAQVPKFFSP